MVMRRLVAVAAFLFLASSIQLQAQRGGGGHASAGGHGGFSGHASFGGGFAGNHSFGGVRAGSGFASRSFSPTSSFRGPLPRLPADSTPTASIAPVPSTVPATAFGFAATATEIVTDTDMVAAMVMATPIPTFMVASIPTGGGIRIHPAIRTSNIRQASLTR